MIRDIGRGLARGLTLLALLLFAAVAPLLPTNDQKVRATMTAAVVLVAATYLRVRTKEPLGRSSLDFPAVTFLCVAGLATIVSVDPLISFFPSTGRGEGLVVYVAYVVMALAVARLGRREIDGLVGAIVISGSLIGAIAVAQYYGLDVIRWLGYRPGSPAEAMGLAANPLPGVDAPVFLWTRSYGTLGNPVFLGGYVSILLPVAVAVALQQPGRRWLAYAAASALLYGALVASQTRSAWVASAGASLLLLGWVSRTRPGWRRLAVIAAVFAAITVVMALTRPGAGLSHRAATTVNMTVNMRDQSLRERLYLWKHTLPLIAERPLLGWGFSTLLGRFPDLGSPEYLRVFGPTLVLIDTPHNDVLHIAFSTGLVGLAAYLWVWAAIAMALRGPSRGGSTMPRLDGAFLASFAAYGVWLQLAWSHVGPANIFWIFAGVAAALGRQAVTTEAALGATIPAPPRGPARLTVSTPQTNA